MNFTEKCLKQKDIEDILECVKIDSDSHSRKTNKVKSSAF